MPMDSGNYNNIESSSGGLREFGSLPDSVVVPSLLKPSSSTHFNPSLTFFEPSSSRSVLGAQGLGQVPFPSSMSMQPRQPVDDVHGTVVTKNPKKRTRASRKAPTTVLTTDTTNFRAMVQEFTGIPAPPFSNSSSFSPKLDLFGSRSLGGIRSGHLGTLRSSANERVQPASTQLLNNNIPLVEASNMLNLQNQMVQPLSQGTSVSASTMASLDELGFTLHFNGNWRDGVRLNNEDEDHLRPFDGIYGNGHNINA